MLSAYRLKYGLIVVLPIPPEGQKLRDAFNVEVGLVEVAINRIHKGGNRGN